MDCKVKRTSKGYNDYRIVFSGMTRGTIMSLKNALERHVQHGSACAGDTLGFLVAGIKESGDERLVSSVLDAPNLAGDVISVDASSFPDPCPEPGE